MRDLGVLKERIEYAERHLTASHTARERESQALMQMWQQIRERFELQEEEIARYRAQLSELTAANDELTALVDRLIASVEGGIADSGNETVPAIAQLADELLRSEPGDAAPAAAPAGLAKELEEILELDTPAPEPAFEAEAAAEPETATAPETSFSENLKAALAEEDDGDEDDEISIPSSEPVHQDSASEGIRNLISRIEDAVASPSNETELNGAAASDKDEDEDLTRELEEIESLRNELNGLRNKISADG